jgi:predicted RNA-binding Zn ribbon-like protein
MLILTMSKISTISEMDLAGGAACLDFVNTMLNEKDVVERVQNYSDLLTLSGRLSILSEHVLEALRILAENNPVHAERVLLKAREVRKSMLDIFLSLASGHINSVTPSKLKTFNIYINEALDERRFVISDGVLKTAWEHPEKKLMQPVWGFCLSAYDLLNNRDQKLIKQCGACAWLFLDDTKNHRRKWCDMQTCGANQKARRHYQRQKKTT